MQSGDALASFLVGRLAQAGERDAVVLKVHVGRFPIPGSARVLAAAGGRLWLAAGSLLGGPSTADVPLSAVREARVDGVRLVLRTTEAVLRFTVVDGEPAVAAFLRAVVPQTGTTTAG